MEARGGHRRADGDRDRRHEQARGRTLEYGFVGADSLGRIFNQPPFLHVGPERFVAVGDRVVNLDVKEPEEDPGSRASWVCVDAADWQAVDEAVTEAHRTHGSLDVVIANAGISVRHAALDITEKGARRIADINLLGVLGLWQSAGRVMAAQDGAASCWPRRRSTAAAATRTTRTTTPPRAASSP